MPPFGPSLFHVSALSRGCHYRREMDDEARL
jgi:hypothetical protein